MVGAPFAVPLSPHHPPPPPSFAHAVVLEGGRYVRDFYVVARGSVDIMAPLGRDGSPLVFARKGVHDYFGATRFVVCSWGVCRCDEPVSL